MDMLGKAAQYGMRVEFFGNVVDVGVIGTGVVFQERYDMHQGNRLDALRVAMVRAVAWQTSQNAQRKSWIVSGKVSHI